jgi:hypothetical protein
MRFAIFLSSLAMASSRQLAVAPENLSVELTSAVADPSSNALTYTWDLGSEAVIGTTLSVDMFPTSCWSGGEDAPLTPPTDIIIGTAGDVTTITWTDEALFQQVKDAPGGKYEFCVVARSYVDGPLYTDFSEVVTTLTVTNLGAIEGTLTITAFTVGSAVTEKDESTLAPDVALAGAVIDAELCGDSATVGPSTFISICISQDAIPYGVHLQAIDELSFELDGTTQTAFSGATEQTLTNEYTCGVDGSIETCRFDTLLKADFFKAAGILYASGSITLDDNLRRQLRSSTSSTRGLKELNREFHFEIEIPSLQERESASSAASGLVGASLSFVTMVVVNALFLS